MDRLGATDLPGSGRDEAAAELPWLERASLFSSGSDALARLVTWGASRYGWRRVWLPSYYCPDVPAALVAAAANSVELLAYPDASPWTATDLGLVSAVAGDVVVIANQLGVRARPEMTHLAGRAVIVEDHSHDLGSEWARDSDADYAFASLRKTLPIPDGGAVWSPRGRELPPEPAIEDERERRLADRLAAALDRRRREGPADDRLRFRALARAAAASIGPGSRGGISPVSRALLPRMPVRAWRERRRRNLSILAEAAGSASSARILRAPAGGVAFALTLVFEAGQSRRRARRALEARAVVPTVLWPLDPARDWGAGPADADLAGRILSIQGDQRYGDADMERLAGILREALRD